MHLADKTNALARECTDEALRLARIADCHARRVDAGGDRRLRDDAAIPHGLDQLVAADDAVTIANDVKQQVEYLRLERLQGLAGTQFSPRRIERESGKGVCSLLHEWSPRPRRSRRPSAAATGARFKPSK